MQSIDVYVAKPVACPYLPERQERKLLVPLADAALYDELIAVGFRRSGRWAYRPQCVGCIACVPVRVPVASFRPRRSQRRAHRAVATLRRRRAAPQPSPELYALFSAYLTARHHDGSMAGMGEAEFAEMLLGSAVHTELWTWSDADDRPIAAMLVDRVADGLSLVYSFFDTARPGSLGAAMILDAIEVARADAIPHVYLGYWVEGCRKMEYKAAFAPLEAFGAAGWQPLELPAPPQGVGDAGTDR